MFSKERLRLIASSCRSASFSTGVLTLGRCDVGTTLQFFLMACEAPVWPCHRHRRHLLVKTWPRCLQPNVYQLVEVLYIDFGAGSGETPSNTQPVSQSTCEGRLLERLFTLCTLQLQAWPRQRGDRRQTPTSAEEKRERKRRAERNTMAGLTTISVFLRCFSLTYSAASCC